MSSPPLLQVAVVMERIAAPNAWEDWHFRVIEVVPDEGVFGSAPRQLLELWGKLVAGTAFGVGEDQQHFAAAILGK